MKHYPSADVIVIGAGPAGAVTSLLLARAGARVLVLDRAGFPRSKPCGDCLSFGASALLDELGLLHAVSSAPHARIRAWRIHAPGGASFEAAFPTNGSAEECAISIERFLLDAILLDAARAAGASFERATVRDVVRNPGGRVIGVATDHGVRSAPLTIGADGLRSIIAARLGARARPGRLRKLSLTYHGTVPCADEVGEMHVGDGVCAGLAPVDTDGRCNLTIVADSTRFGRAVAADASAFAQSAIESLPALRGRIPAAVFATPPLSSGPFDRPVRRTVFPGAVLVGDAAGYYDPFTGQGVHQAIASAKLLARLVGEGAPLERYEHERRAMLRSARLVQRTIELVLSRPKLAEHAVRHIGRAPAFAQAIVAVTGDAAPARTLLTARSLASLIRPVQPEPA